MDQWTPDQGFVPRPPSWRCPGSDPGRAAHSRRRGQLMTASLMTSARMCEPSMYTRSNTGRGTKAS
ncbi:hypothetical protein CHLRE_06g269908v5 [Chlamydomonas reinhardtii]|uniref:Uncharacterized protein n=1 Tax=Chlamydomonas reinhardtii TaxID=3055 RepID=A0A2K3DN91_CHLRE|nr:uncharacterized protein CHLRE_06g269908v5 [Chlamydomonas reinhardtii]PNW82009.1 hypothetical protein CHLRE_06g269908v5 [Chlamydomonas reinhardtii]